MGWHGNKYITAQHILDQSDRLVKSDYFVENSSRKIREALQDSTDMRAHYERVIEGWNLNIVILAKLIKSLGWIL